MERLRRRSYESLYNYSDIYNIIYVAMEAYDNCRSYLVSPKKIMWVLHRPQRSLGGGITLPLFFTIILVLFRNRITIYVKLFQINYFKKEDKKCTIDIRHLKNA